MHVIIRTISSFFPHQKILFLSKVMPLKICDTSPGLSNSIRIHYILYESLNLVLKNITRLRKLDSLLNSLKSPGEFKGEMQKFCRLI